MEYTLTPDVLSPARAAALLPGSAGARIAVVGAPITLSSCAPFHVRHGWTTGPFWESSWTGLAPDVHRELSSGIWRFELSTSLDTAPGTGVVVACDLHAVVTRNRRAVLAMDRWCSVTYPARAFSLGNVVVFTGRWYGDTDHDGVGMLEFETSRTVTFV
jgi:hypothetical protein